MRPLIMRVPSKNRLKTQSPLALLMGQHGPYCMVSERPLTDAASVWHPVRGIVTDLKNVVSSDEWPSLYLLDPLTAAAVEKAKALPPENLIHPGLHLSFSLNGSPFTYGLHKISVTYLDEDGEPEGAPMYEEHVLVTSATAEGKNTIRFFALNSIYFNEEDGSLTIPRSDYLSMTDHRLHSRTETWHKISHCISLFQQAEDTATRSLMLQSMRQTAAATGHWSLWATQLWRACEDRTIMASVLGAPVNTEELMAAAQTGDPDLIGHGPHNIFANTNSNWLGQIEPNP